MLRRHRKQGRMDADRRPTESAAEVGVLIVFAFDELRNCYRIGAALIRATPMITIAGAEPGDQDVVP
jgi:hypothetical protein